MLKANRSTQITLITTGLCVGVVVQRLSPGHTELLVLVVGVVAILLLRVRLGLLAILACLLGVWRADITDFKRSEVAQHLGQTVTVVGSVSDDAAINERSQAAFIVQIRSLNGALQTGSIRIYTASFKALQRGYEVQVEGKLQPAKGAVQSQISFAQVAILSTRQSPLERWRQRFFASMRSAMPEPMSGFGLGLLVGARAMIDKLLQDTLNAVGLSHLIAVSGYNLTIIIQAMRRLLVRISTFSATAASLWMIGGFLLVTGFSASIVRAALVSGLGLWVRYYGYDAKPMTLIAIPAFITVAWNPDYLLKDLGWQLSFLAFFGIMVLAPLAEQRLVRQPNVIKSLVLESLAAQILTAPLIVAIFNNLSVISPISNVILLPLVPLAMLLAATTGVVGLANPILATWLALPTIGLLGLMVGMIQWFATWPYATIQIGISATVATGCYVMIGIITIGLYRTSRRSLFDR